MSVNVGEGYRQGEDIRQVQRDFERAVREGNKPLARAIAKANPEILGGQGGKLR